MGTAINGGAFKAVGATALLCLLIAAYASDALGANMRNFIEAVRRKAAVVYVGRVREVQLLARTKFDIKARATIDVTAVARTAGPKPHEATLEYSSYDGTTPMLAGGPQYQLGPGTEVVVFTNSFTGNVPPGYLLQGSRNELLQRVKALRDTLQQMTAEQLHVNEIDEQDRRIQLGLYDELTNTLRSAKP